MKIRTVSIIVTTYNRAIRLKHNIRALLNQELESDVEMEIIIVDDCSVKENSELAAVIARQSGLIRLIVNPINKGLSGSRNVGAAHANYEYIFFLDDDIVAEPYYIMGHLSLLSKQSGIATVGSLRFPPELTKGNNLMKYLSSRELRQRSFSQDFLNDLPPQYLGGGICAMRLEDFKVAGGFSESYTFYGGEDVDMGNSLKRIGVRIVYAPFAKADHYDNVNFDRYRIKYMEAGREGIKLMLKTDSHFYENSNIRYLLPTSPNESMKEKIIRFTVQIILGKYSEILLRMVAKLTNRHSLLYSKYLYHALFACWMYGGLRDDKPTKKSEVDYSN